MPTPGPAWVVLLLLGAMLALGVAVPGLIPYQLLVGALAVAGFFGFSAMKGQATWALAAISAFACVGLVLLASFVVGSRI